MNTESIQRMQSDFDALARTHPENAGIEFWFARDLQEPLGYARWENFLTAIRRAIESCETTGYDPGHHFRGVTKMVTLGKGGQREIEDFMLTRYACSPRRHFSPEREVALRPTFQALNSRSEVQLRAPSPPRISPPR